MRRCRSKTKLKSVIGVTLSSFNGKFASLPGPLSLGKSGIVHQVPGPLPRRIAPVVRNTIVLLGYGSQQGIVSNNLASVVDTKRTGDVR
jgi:hypothetical protein